jgi:hypothetical protein
MPLRPGSVAYLMVSVASRWVWIDAPCQSLLWARYGHLSAFLRIVSVLVLA